MIRIKKGMLGAWVETDGAYDLIAMDRDELNDTYVERRLFNDRDEARKRAEQEAEYYKSQWDKLSNTDIGKLNEELLELRGELMKEKDQAANTRSEYIEKIHALQAELKQKEQATAEKITAAVKKRDGEWKDFNIKKFGPLKETLEKTQKDLAAAEEETTVLKAQNENLMRINLQRSNQERGIRPAKSRSGFLVISTGNVTEIKKVYRGTESYRCMKTVVQTPYDVSMALPDGTVKSIADMLGIKHIVSSFEEAADEEANCIYRVFYNYNYRSRYIEITLFSTGWPSVPEDMIPPKRKNRKMDEQNKAEYDAYLRGYNEALEQNGIESEEEYTGEEGYDG